MVNNIEHGRTYGFVTTLSPNAKLCVDFGFNYMDIYTQTDICFPDTGSTIFTTPCPIPGATSPLGTLSFYSSKDYYAYGDVMWKPYKRVTAMLGYAGSIVRGNTTFLNPARRRPALWISITSSRLRAWRLIFTRACPTRPHGITTDITTTESQIQPGLRRCRRRISTAATLRSRSDTRSD